MEQIYPGFPLHLTVVHEVMANHSWRPGCDLLINCDWLFTTLHLAFGTLENIRPIMQMTMP